MKSLDIRVSFGAIDRLTRPTENARHQVGALTESLQKTQNNIQALDRQSKVFDRAAGNLSKYREQIARAEQRLAGLRKAEQSGNALSEKQRETLAALSARLERLNELRTREREKLQAAAGEMRKHGILLSGSSRTIESAVRRTQQYNEQLERERQALTRVTQAQSRYEAAKAQAEKLRNTGAVAMAAGTGGLYAAQRMMAPAMESEQHGAVIAAGSGEGAEDGVRYTHIIRNIQADGLADFAGAAEAVSAVRSTLGALGDTGDRELERISRRALDMRTVYGVDVPQSIQAAAIMMKNGLAASSDEATNLMTAGMQRMSAEMRDELPEILHEYSTHFRNMGFTGSETMSLLVEMAKQGKFALDKTGDAVKEFSIRGSDMSKSSVSAYETLGLNAERVSAAIAQGGSTARQAMQVTARALLAIRDPAERANTAIALFGTPVEDLSVDQIPQFLKALADVRDNLGDVSGVADRMGQTLRGNLSGDVQALSGAFSGLRTDIFGTVTEDLRGLVQTVSAWVTRMREWVGEHQALVRVLVLAGGSVLALSSTFGALSLTLGLIAGPLAKLQLGLGLLTGGGGIGGAVRLVSAMALRLTGLPALWGLVTGAVSVLGGALGALFSPVGLIVAALVGGAVLVWKYWDQISAFFSGFFAGVWEWFTRLLEPANASKETLDKCTRAGESFGKTLGWVIQNIVLGPLTQLLEGLGTVLKWLGVIPDGIREAQKETQKLQESAAKQATQKAPVAWEWDPAQKKMVQKTWSWSSDAAENNGDNKPAIPAPAVPGEVKGTADNPVGNPGSKSPLDEAWFRQGIQKTASNTGGLLEETKKRTGPGDIVFKNLPGSEIIHGEWKAPQVIRTVQAVSAGGGLADVLTTLWQKLTGRQTASPVPAVNIPAPVANVARQVSALPQPRNVTEGMTGAVMDSAPVAEAIRPPLRPEAARREATPQPQAAAFSGEIHVHLHNVNTQNPRELAKLVGEAVREEMRRQARTGMNSFRDRD
ncbi:phage tail tape measure protein [Escherichia marmotae]|uniref:phage tail tape measure protein n=1 Tax=Escherichia marmotae TaxID=1499973 RepID=UPI0015F1AB00|nr:phage tail tape measure protein [Escherichia marmotae]